MKTFIIQYEFFNRTLKPSSWDIGRAVVLEKNEYLASALFWSENPDASVSIMSMEELVTNQIIYAY